MLTALNVEAKTTCDMFMIFAWRCTVMEWRDSETSPRGQLCHALPLEARPRTQPLFDRLDLLAKNCKEASKTFHEAHSHSCKWSIPSLLHKLLACPANFRTFACSICRFFSA